MSSNEEKEGWVYCISNQNVRSADPPNNILLKIGMTDRTPQERLAEANRSDTWRPPVNFKIEFAKKVKNALKKEKTLHKLLEQYNERVNRSREFFDISLEKARLYFDLMDGEYWEPDPDPEPVVEPGAKKADKKEIVVNKKKSVKGGGIPKGTKANVIKINATDKNSKEINVEVNNVIANKVDNNFEAILNANVKDLGAEESRKLLTASFDKESLDIRVGRTYYTFDKLKKIQGKQIVNKVFSAVISSPTQADMYVTVHNIDSVINQLKYKTDSTFILLNEICKL